jgi:hypothetical protein
MDGSSEDGAGKSKMFRLRQGLDFALRRIKGESSPETRAFFGKSIDRRAEMLLIAQNF